MIGGGKQPNFTIIYNQKNFLSQLYSIMYFI